MFSLHNKVVSSFLARDSIYAIARYNAIDRPSVRPSHGWTSPRRLKSGSCNFHHKVAPWP